jgi:hypothetical protein
LAHGGIIGLAGGYRQGKRGKDKGGNREPERPKAKAGIGIRDSGTARLAGEFTRRALLTLGAEILPPNPESRFPPSVFVSFSIKRLLYTIVYGNAERGAWNAESAEAGRHGSRQKDSNNPQITQIAKFGKVDQPERLGYTSPGGNA